MTFDEIPKKGQNPPTLLTSTQGFLEKKKLKIDFKKNLSLQSDKYI